MTENQIAQMMKMMNQCVSGIQRLEGDMKVVKSDVAELKSDVTEIKHGQARLEKEMQTTNQAFDSLAGDSIRTRARIDLLEREFRN